MPGPVTNAIRLQKPATMNHEIYSLALIPTAHGFPAAGVQILADYVDSHIYTACHDIAAALVNVLRAPAGVMHGPSVGAAAVHTANNHFGDNMALKVDYGLHSFTLIARAGRLECIEGWAGGNAVYRNPVHNSIFNDERASQVWDAPGIGNDPIVIPQLAGQTTVVAARAAIAELLSPVQATRARGCNRISRAGLGGFGPINAVPNLSVECYALDTDHAIGARYAALAEIAADWGQMARQHVTQRWTCSRCLAPHGYFSSWWNIWGQCGGNCARVYCPTCRGQLPNFVFAGATHRSCCGQATDDLDGSGP